MTPRKSQQAPKPKTIWEEKKAPSAALDPKLTVETARKLLHRIEVAEQHSRRIYGC